MKRVVSIQDISCLGKCSLTVALPIIHGINGNVLFVDGGTDALLNSEKVY